MLRLVRCLHVSISLILAACLAGSLVAADPAPSADALSQAELQEAFKVLRSRFIRASILNYETLNRSALDGLLTRLGDGAELVPKKSAKAEEETPPPFHAEILAPKLAYLRLAGYSNAELAKIEEAMSKFREAAADFLILDLRVPQPKPDLTATARFLDRFVPPDTMLYRIQHPGEKTPQLFISQQAPQRWKGPIILLLDSETSSAGELIAATILRNYPAFSIGEKTSGATVEYAEIALNESLSLRFAEAEILLPDDQSLFQKGITPTYVISQSLDLKHRVFDATGYGPLGSHVFEKSRPRLNEAALVHETDPELDYHLARARGETTPFDVIPLLDKVLQRAVDLVVTLRRTPPSAPAPVKPAKPQGTSGM